MGRGSKSGLSPYSSWRLEMPTASGRWEKTPHSAQLGEVLRVLADDYPWMLARV